MEVRLYQILAVFLMTVIIMTANGRSIEDSDAEGHAVREENIDGIEPDRPMARASSTENNIDVKEPVMSEQNFNEMELKFARMLSSKENNKVPANTVSGEIM